MQKLEVKNGQVTGWYCGNCQGYNDIVTPTCRYCRTVQRDESLAVFASHIQWERLGLFVEAKMSEIERELHADFFTKWDNEEALFIADMSEEELTSHRNELAKILLEAKVKTTRADNKLRQMRAERITKGKPWLVGSENPSEVSELRKGIESRKERMSKEDKILAMMKDLGVENSESIIKKVTDDKLKNFKIVKTTPAVEVKPVEKRLEESEPFDFTKLE